MSNSKPNPQDNHILAALSPNVQGRLFPHLEQVSLSLCALMYESHAPMSHVYFPTDSVVSLQYLLENGETTAISIVGNEGMLGVHLFMGALHTPSRSLVQSAGYAYRLPSRVMKLEFDRHGELMRLMLRYTQVLLAQVSQTAVCNRHHSIFQQVCRWLLLSIDRLSGDRLMMTQDFIANMLGVRREGVTEAANKLKQLGVITYARGRIQVIDRSKLESLACECYEAVKAEMDVLLDYLPQHQIIENSDSIRRGTLPEIKGCAARQG